MAGGPQPCERTSRPQRREQTNGGSGLGGLWTTVSSYGTPVYPHCSPGFPKSSTGCARPVPPGAFRGRSSTCFALSVPGKRGRPFSMGVPSVLNLQPSSRRGPPRPALGAGNPRRLHRCGSLQHSRRQRAAGQPRPPPGRAGPTYPVQLSARQRYGRTEAEGLRPRRDRSPRRRRHARGTVPLSH